MLSPKSETESVDIKKESDHEKGVPDSSREMLPGRGGIRSSNNLRKKLTSDLPSIDYVDSSFAPDIDLPLPTVKDKKASFF